MTKWFRTQDDKPIITHACYGYEIFTQDYKGYKKPLSLLQGSYNNNKKCRFKIMIWREYD